MEIIEADGERPYFRVLNKKEYLKEIKKKLIEEARELYGAKNKKELLNEMADLWELINVLAGELGIARSQIAKKQKEKREKRGGFKKRLFLIKTEK